ncbi:hypothetical protein CBF90_01540 [Microbacterium sp. AISO3]|jgi:hypothetical protein|uniref:LigA n=1 Tax=Microbacterium arborescens TaxID=33883 RepID=A0ABX2WNB9_9MICO|nr:MULTISPECIES: DUF4194 domain-containing protein [Microbacterium]OAZ44573.1 hypothetical protein A9Z40_11790 [Microbacterium arborescens]OWP20399.1 hypothetical protein CBF90_17705 [Microbacterium sp. AISO3]OWP23448.1 hypothetical protein CBF90_01540 [Microbacterium sp. AISO3]POX68326.1 DUF4194 domain-containing protein [Microbacterium sp. Ru50]QCR39004.1 DUF4194 domain-containing protein [Microbacterium sp. SGAir0570]
MTDTATLGAAQDEAPGDGAFVEPAAMEDDLGELFPGDRGVLDPAVRRVLVHLLQRRFVLADRNREEWTALLDNQQLVESRLNDLFVRLVIDHDRGVAYKQQVRSDELDVPILLRDAAYTRSETLVLVHLRTVYQRESAAGEPAARVDIEDVEQTVMSYFADADGDTAKRQRLIRKAMDRLARDGIVDEETTGRFRISPLVEIVLSAEKLRELRDWLRDRSGADDTGGIAAGEDEDEEGDDEPQEEEL